MAQHGGYRKPANPAPVSGPGSHSQRTDGGPGHPAQSISVAPDQEYGAMSEQAAAQRIAPMGGATPMPPAASPGPGGPAAPPSSPAYAGGPFNAPTARPGEPVTAGAPAGPGPGPEALSAQQPVAGMAQATGAMTRMLSQFAPTDGSGVIAALLMRAQSLGV